MVGSASSVIITTEAPMMPVVAAMIVPITVTERARPPGTRRSMTCRICSRSAATRERSSIVPMKMKQGIATRTGFCTAPLDPSPPQIRGRMMKNSRKSIRSNPMPRKPKSSAIPPSAMATGMPVKSMSARARNM